MNCRAKIAGVFGTFLKKISRTILLFASHVSGILLEKDERLEFIYFSTSLSGDSAEYLTSMVKLFMAAFFKALCDCKVVGLSADVAKTARLAEIMVACSQRIQFALFSATYWAEFEDEELCSR